LAGDKSADQNNRMNEQEKCKLIWYKNLEQSRPKNLPKETAHHGEMRLVYRITFCVFVGESWYQIDKSKREMWLTTP